MNTWKKGLVRFVNPTYFVQRGYRLVSLQSVSWLKRLSLVKTTSWQHRFLDLTNLAPMWLGTYEYMKSTLKNLFFHFETGFPEWIFQIWPKNFKSDRVLVYMKKSLF